MDVYDIFVEKYIPSPVGFQAEQLDKSELQIFMMPYITVYASEGKARDIYCQRQEELLNFKTHGFDGNGLLIDVYRLQFGIRYELEAIYFNGV